MQNCCPKCQSERWMTGLPLVHPSDISVAVVLPGLLTPAKGFSPVRAHVCADCGFTEFYAVAPLTVWEAWRREQKV